MDPIEAEVDAIRRKIWEETKHMTPDERIADLIRRTDPIIQEFHMKTSRLQPAKLGYRPRIYEDYASL
ncbi:MAG: hypothetical protein IJG51_08095 [Synergistaceae bacterium]|nr:hypothetical protein [Synergistaceae bacterium]MBQ3398835.1 hypothetical protein [Synergistaceae bacterium]MBQ3758988.1 hypothetical protein [Synergistaceae bacterium]MBQ4401119.1 hypothetical protein [Synergistaceae bacterium]MBQ6115051.1 hypothetical protein [Synergistaceae bacterium]